MSLTPQQRAGERIDALVYFDGQLISLTATLSAQTLGVFFNNLAVEYPYEQSAVDLVTYQISEKPNELIAARRAAA